MDTEPPDLTQLAPDTIRRGCLFGCLWQAGLVIVSLLAANCIRSSKLAGVLIVSWGLTQWIALIPLILQQRAKGYPRTVQGILITGCIGFLLCSLCGATFIHS
jgi:hypothetical protein